MTTGHAHRILHVREKGALLHLLQTPLARSTDYERVCSSRWTWGPEGPEPYAGDGPVRTVLVYRLTILGVLHTLTGLTVCTTPREHVGHEHP